MKLLAKLSIYMIFIFITFLNFKCKPEPISENKPKKSKYDKNIIWKHGVAVIDGIPKFIDQDKLIIPVLFKSKRTIVKSKSPIIKAGKISILSGKNKYYFWIYDIDKSHGLYNEILESRKKFQYKIENNNMYISKDGINWDRIYLKIVNEKPKDKSVFIVIYLKCKFFQGEYEIGGH